MEFKVGDRVRIKTNCSGAKAGETCTLELCNSHLWARGIDGMCSCQHNWELIKQTFQVGDEVKCIDAPHAHWFDGAFIYTASYSGGKTGVVKGFKDGRLVLDNGEQYNPKAFEIVKKGGKEMDLIQRIVAIKAWDKEADDVLNEVLQRKYELVVISQSDGHTGHFHIYQGSPHQYMWDGRDSVIHFSFNDQCEKLEAFKEALLWLAEKYKPALVGKEVKAEIEGKTYKVKVLEKI